jgi:hypothetical protein
MEKETNLILSKLDSIKEELDYIKKNMVEKDEIMVAEEFEAYKRSFNKKNLVSLEEVKKDLGI